jgi:hypothetical protein
MMMSNPDNDSKVMNVEISSLLSHNKCVVFINNNIVLNKKAEIRGAIMTMMYHLWAFIKHFGKVDFFRISLSAMLKCRQGPKALLLLCLCLYTAYNYSSLLLTCDRIINPHIL